MVTNKKRDRREYRHNHYIQNIEKEREYNRIYKRGYYKKRSEHLRNYMRDYNKKIRLEVLSYYSNGKNECECCGEKEIGFLTIDHPNNDGSKHRKTVNSTIYQWLKKNNFPPGFRVQCYNCNIGRDRQPDKICPHKKVI